MLVSLLGILAMLHFSQKGNARMKSVTGKGTMHHLFISVVSGSRTKKLHTIAVGYISVIDLNHSLFFAQTLKEVI